MTRRTRMLAAGLMLAVTGGLAVSTAPAQAATGPVPVGFRCTENLLGSLVPIPLGTVTLPADLSVLDNLTVPIGTTIAPVTGTLGLAPLLDTLGSTLGTVVGVTSHLVAQVGSSSVTAALDPLTGAVQLPAIPVPGLPGNLPVSLAPGSSISFGLKGLLGTALGSVSCVLPALSGQLATILVRTPSQISTGTTVGGGPVSYGGGSTGGAASSSGGAGGGTSAGGPAGGSTAANPCVVPLARGTRTAGLAARTARRSTPSQAAPRIVVRAPHARAARGSVVACYGTIAIAGATLRHGRAVLTLPRFYPGHYRIGVRYLGGSPYRGAARMVRLSVTGSPKLA